MRACQRARVLFAESGATAGGLEGSRGRDWRAAGALARELWAMNFGPASEIFARTAARFTTPPSDFPGPAEIFPGPAGYFRVPQGYFWAPGRLWGLAGRFLG